MTDTEWANPSLRAALEQIRAEVREDCAKICDSFALELEGEEAAGWQFSGPPTYGQIARRLATRIRFIALLATEDSI